MIHIPYLLVCPDRYIWQGEQLSTLIVLVFQCRRVLVEKRNDGHARVLMLHREVAQGDKLLDDVRLPKVNLHINIFNLTKSSRRRWIVARGCRGSPPPSWTPPMCRSCNPLRKSPAKLWPINNINLYRVRRWKAMTTRETSSHNFDQMSQRSQVSKVKSSRSVNKRLHFKGQKSNHNLCTINSQVQGQVWNNHSYNFRLWQ